MSVFCLPSTFPKLTNRCLKLTLHFLKWRFSASNMGFHFTWTSYDKMDIDKFISFKIKMSSSVLLLLCSLTYSYLGGEVGHVQKFAA
jgi:hypothetical protein